MNKTQVTTAMVFIVLMVIGFSLVKKFMNPAESFVYEVLVQARDQSGNGSPEEVARTTLQKGDVLLVKKGEKHSWSKTEKVSYLILKMKLTEDEAQKLVMPVERKLTRVEKKKEMEQFENGREDAPKEEMERFKDELDQRRVTTLMRKYRVNMEKYFSDFEPNALAQGQPYQEKIYDWDIVEKK